MATITTFLTATDIVAMCESEWPKYQHDCSGFVRAVAADIGIGLTGLANDLVDYWSKYWAPAADGVAAAIQAAHGNFVVAGLKANPHGHVVVIVDGPMNRGIYPTGYWGRLGGVGKKKATINWAWNKTDLASVKYFYYNGPMSPTS